MVQCGPARAEWIDNLLGPGLATCFPPVAGARRSALFLVFFANSFLYENMEMQHFSTSLG
jgi:hypothetical protein